MALKIFRAGWFLSLLVALAVLLFVYASLPEQVVVREEAAKLVSLSRDGVFYLAMVIMAIVNVLVYIVAKIFSKNEGLRTWFYGLIITLNVFFIISLSLINTFNSGEHFDYARIDFIIYGSLALIVLWAISWPFYNLYRNFLGKQAV